MYSVLILGGTHFIGRHLVERLAEFDFYNITLFNRGITNPELFSDYLNVRGDRNVHEDLEVILKQNWDYVIDLSCYFPESLRHIVRNINPAIKKYIFISTCSVYNCDVTLDKLKDENALLLTFSKDHETDESVASYGNRKAACENVLEKSNLPYLIFRPALVYGPYDSSDRFYYWIYATQSSKPYLLPESGQRQFSVTYVKDLVNCILEGIENDISKEVFNCVSQELCSISKTLSVSTRILNKSPNLIPATAEFLKNESVAEWVDIPMWLNSDGFTFSNAKLRRRMNFESIPFEEAVQETISYYKEKGFPEPKTGLSEVRLQQLISKLKNG